MNSNVDINKNMNNIASIVIIIIEVKRKQDNMCECNNFKKFC